MHGGKKYNTSLKNTKPSYILGCSGCSELSEVATEAMSQALEQNSNLTELNEEEVMAKIQCKYQYTIGNEHPIKKNWPR